MYSASSSLRACTLRLPSLVFSSALSSLKVRLSRTARALTIASRTRSWISRSRAAAAGCALALTAPARSPSRRVSRAVLLLATVPPCDDQSKYDLQDAEAGGEQPRLPDRRCEQGQRSQEHETDTHHRHDAHREGAAGDDAGAITQHPDAGEEVQLLGVPEHVRQERSDEEGRQHAETEAAAGTLDDRVADAHGLVEQRRDTHAGAKQRFEHPDPEPAALRLPV